MAKSISARVVPASHEPIVDGGEKIWRQTKKIGMKYVRSAESPSQSIGGLMNSLDNMAKSLTIRSNHDPHYLDDLFGWRDAVKIVLNKCHGGFGLSHEAMMLYGKLKGIKLYHEPDKNYSSFRDGTYWKVPKAKRPKIFSHEQWMKASLEERIDNNKKHTDATVYDKDIPRTDEALIKTVEELGEKANGMFAQLEIVDIPDGVDWEIEEYDGSEWVAERHRTW